MSTWSVTWTLTNSGGAGSSQATLSGQIVAPVVVQDLVSQWRLDNSDGVTFPDTGPANIPMTLVGTWQNLTLPSMVTGLTGTSAATGKAGAYATIPANQAAHALTALTLSIYFQRNSALDKQVIFALGDPNTAAIGDLSIEVLQTGVLRGYHVGGDGALRFFEGTAGITGTNLAEGVAHRIDLTLGAAGAKIYLDGTPLPAATIVANTNGWNNAQVKYLGVFSDGVSVPANGAFDHIRLFNRQFSDAEIAALPAAVSITIPALPPVAVGGTFADATQNSILIVDVLAAAGTYYQGTPTLTVNSGSATVDTSGSRPRLNISTTTTGVKTITWTLTHSAGAGSSQATTTGNVVAVVASALPLVPTLDFLPSDGILPGSNLVYVYDSNLGNGSGSSAANAKEIQSAINSASAGQTLVAIAAQAGGTSSYNRTGTSGLSFANAGNGTSGAKITLMARPGDTVIIDKGVEFSAYRTPSSGTGAKWELYDSNQKIWRSVATNFGGSVRQLGGFWLEGGWPQYILPCDSLSHLQAPVGLSNIWTNYGGPAALVHSDGRIYIRFQVPYPGKMSVGNRWPVDARMDYVPGWIAKSGGRAGQLNIPATEDPRDYQVWLCHSPGFGGAKNAYNMANKSWWVIGEGINSFGYEFLYVVNGATNIEWRRGTDIGTICGIYAPGSTGNGPFLFNRRRASHGSIKHQPLVNWKFGGALESTHRGSFHPYSQGTYVNNVVMRNCTLHGWHDLVVGYGNNWDLQQCNIVNQMDDGYQIVPSAFTNVNLHYCYMLDSSFGGCEQSGNAPGPWYVSHNIFDNRCPRIVDCTNPQGTPFFMPLNQEHMQGGGELPKKWYNNTIIVSCDSGGFNDTYIAHIRGDNPAVLGPFHELFNNIWVRADYQRYNGTAGGTPPYWDYIDNPNGQSDEIVSRMVVGGGSKEIYDYEILYRNLPTIVTPLFREIVNTPIFGQAIGSHNPNNYSTLSSWLASSQFQTSKGIYSPGFHSHSLEINPQIPSAAQSVPSFDVRRDYRPRASQANNGFTGTTNSPAGQSMAGWAVKPSPWIGALDPAGTTCPVGVQLP